MVEQTAKKELQKTKKAQYAVKALPLFMGLSNDLMFYIAINTLFFTVVKGMSASQITFLTTFSGMGYILLQRPALMLIHRIGNTSSVRLGALFLLVGSILLTFGPSYPIIIIGHLFYTCAFLFKSMDNVMLRNDLAHLGEQEQYLFYKNRAVFLYSTITTIVALISGGIFKINPYYPMYLCIGVCLLNVVLSFTLKDVDETRLFVKEEKKEKLHLEKKLLLILLLSGAVASLVNMGQSNVKLLIQYQLSDYFDAGTTASLFSIVLVLSRISRIVSSLCFNKIYHKFHNRLMIVAPVMLGLSFVLSISGYFCPMVPIKFGLMTAGFCIILGIRDVYTIVMQNLALQKSDPKEHQRAISYQSLLRRIFDTAMSFVVTLILLKIQIIWVIFILLAFACGAVFLNFTFYQKNLR